MVFVVRRMLLLLPADPIAAARRGGQIQSLSLPPHVGRGIERGKRASLEFAAPLDAVRRGGADLDTDKLSTTSAVALPLFIAGLASDVVWNRLPVW